MPDPPTQCPDATEAYRRWDELYSAGVRLALSTTTGEPAERAAARQRLLRAHERALAQRDALWERIATKWKGERDVG
ncbi:MAG: hypothetical protein JXA90_17140 [Planctomycetes bacterium]|nr:hypothetical protein [Planctomycetota bacterium]